MTSFVCSQPKILLVLFNSKINTDSNQINILNVLLHKFFKIFFMNRYVKERGVEALRK